MRSMRRKSIIISRSCGNRVDVNSSEYSNSNFIFLNLGITLVLLIYRLIYIKICAVLFLFSLNLDLFLIELEFIQCPNFGFNVSKYQWKYLLIKRVDEAGELISRSPRCFFVVKERGGGRVGGNQ